MEYVIGVIVLVLLVGVWFYFRKLREKIDKEDNITNEIKLAKISSKPKESARDRPFDEKMDILLGEITKREFDETKLMEITDPSILSRVSSLVPVIANESANLLNQPKIPIGGLYEVIMPSGATLVDSKDMIGASRGYFRGAEGISGHANLVPVELGSKLGNVMGTVSSIMNVASIMVGQYYMSEINSRLQNIENDIKSISNFQKNEFESNIITKIVDVMELSKFSDEIVRSDEVRLSKLNRIENLKGEMAQLIEQLILQIDQELVALNKKKFIEYEEKSRNLDKQIKLLISLMMSLQELGNIELILGKGERSGDLVFHRYNIEEKKVLSLFESIQSWHSDHGIVYEIDLENSRRPKKGVRGTVGTLQAIRDESKKYDLLESNFSDLLKKHSELSLKDPVQIPQPDKVKIIYNSENEKSFIALD